MPNRGLIDAGRLRSVRTPSERRLFGMPVRVWTLAIWFAIATIADGASFLLPYNNDSPLAPRIVGAAFTIGAIVLMVIWGDRTPTWFLHVLVIVSIAFMVWLTASAETNTGSLTAMMILLVLAAYTAYTMTYLQAIAYVAASAIGILVMFAVEGRLEVLILPWAIVTLMGFGQVAILGTLVSDLKHQVVIDPLTGLLNRAGLELVTDAPDLDRVLPEPRAIVVIDLDDFKLVNDERGHAEGDRVLREVGDAILRACRSDDVAVRFGGDEFVLLLPRTEEAAAAAFALRVRDAVRVSCSTGATRWIHGEALHHAIARADRLMYANKPERRPGFGDARDREG